MKPCGCLGKIRIDEGSGCVCQMGLGGRGGGTYLDDASKVKVEYNPLMMRGGEEK